MKKIFVLLLILSLLHTPVAHSAGTIPEPMARLGRITFVGNSLTQHPPKADIGWRSNWGMAATQPDRDYVHRVQLGATALMGQVVEIDVVRSDIPFPNLDAARRIVEFDPDIIIIQMGNNAPRTTPLDDWVPLYWQIRSAAPGTRIIVVGLWAVAGDDVREGYAKTMASMIGAEFVPIWDIYSDATNGVADGVYTDPGVRWHPGDAGMAAIADRILARLTRYTATLYAPLIISGENE